MPVFATAANVARPARLRRRTSLARLAAVAAVVALLGMVGIAPAVEDSTGGARAAGPLPACRYDDILTSPRGYDDWEITLVDTILRVPKSYAPPDLVAVADLGVPGRGAVRAVLAEDLKALSEAAAAAGNPIGVHSPYRSYADQQAVFAHWVAVHGRRRALQLSARPGHSEHQLGLAVDFRSEPQVATLQGSWGTTPAGKWMRNHGWEYGFLMSYPKGKIDVVCYSYEPWHFRYVGRELAAQVHASGLTVREYLWRNFTTTVVPPPTPKPTARPVPAATVRPSPRPTIKPTPSAVPTAPPTTLPSAVPSAPPVASPTVAAAPSGAPASLPPTLPPPEGPPGSDPFDPATAGSVALAGAGIVLGTIVLGGVILMRRRGGSGVGL